MRAMQLQQADGAAAVAKSDKILAEDPKFQRQVLQLVRVADRLPEAPHVLAAGRIRADMRQLGVFQRNMAVMVSTITGLRNGALVTIANLLFMTIYRAVEAAAQAFFARLMEPSGSEQQDSHEPRRAPSGRFEPTDYQYSNGRNRR